MANPQGVTRWDTCVLCAKPAKVWMPHPERPNDEILGFCKVEHRDYWMKRFHARRILVGQDPGDQNEAMEIIQAPIPD